VHHGVVGELDALPTIVAIHRIVAANHGGNFADAELAHFLPQLLDEFATAVRRSIAAVHEAVDKNVFDSLPFGEFEEREKMLDVRVNAAVAE
jgi:hypothetical protein